MSNEVKRIFIDQNNIDLYTDPDEKFFLLKESEALILLSQVPYIAWRKRWKNLSYTQEELNQLTADIADKLMNPIESLIMDCNDVENCLPASPTILSIGTDINTAQASADTAQASADTAQASADTAQAKADELEQTSPTNEYIPPPTIAQPDRLCQVTDYISKELRTDIITIIDGTLFNSYIDGVKYFMSIGGYNWASISALIQLIFASVNVNLETEILDARSEVHEILYCNEMDFTQSAIDIDASSTISSDAKTCYTAIMASWTASKKALIASIGEANSGADCSLFCPPACDIITALFVTLPQQTGVSGTLSGGVWNSSYFTEFDNEQYGGIHIKTDAINYAGKSTIEIDYTMIKGTWDVSTTMFALVSASGLIVGIPHPTIADGSGTFTYDITGATGELQVVLRRSRFTNNGSCSITEIRVC